MPAGLAMLLYGPARGPPMNVEYEEFENVRDMFAYLSAVAPPMKNTFPVNSYKGYVSSIIPLGSSADAYLMFFAKGPLEPGVYEFDISKMEYRKVDAVERADKTYFVCVAPKRNTLADAAIEKI